MSCPWCEEEDLLVLPEVQEPRASFSCAECGTTVDFAEDVVALDIAA
jgi:hypothetical protein